MELLPRETISELFRVVTELELEREVLLAGIDSSYISGLPNARTPAGQVLSDLRKLNETRRLLNGNAPFEMWLENAHALSRCRVEAMVFQDALRTLRAILPPAPTVNAHRTTPEERTLVASRRLIEAADRRKERLSIGLPTAEESRLIAVLRQEVKTNHSPQNSPLGSIVAATTIAPSTSGSDAATYGAEPHISSAQQLPSMSSPNLSRKDRQDATPSTHTAHATPVAPPFGARTIIIALASTVVVFALTSLLFVIALKVRANSVVRPEATLASPSTNASTIDIPSSVVNDAPKPRPIVESKPPNPPTDATSTVTTSTKINSPPTKPVSKTNPGFLTIVCNPYCDDVIAAGRSLGPSPIVHLSMPPGKYSIQLKKGAMKKFISISVFSDEVAAQRVPMQE